MDYLKGLLLINGHDAYTEYGVFLGETEPAGTVNSGQLMRMSAAKDITTVDFRERTGVELPENPDIRLSSIARTLQFWLTADTEEARLSQYQQFQQLMVSGQLEFQIAGFRTYNMIYQDMPSDPEWYNSLDKRLYAVLFSIKFLEFKPALNFV